MKSINSGKSLKTSRYFFSLNMTDITHTSPDPLTLILSIYKGMQKLDQLSSPILCAEPQTNLDQNFSSLRFNASVDDTQKPNQYRIIIERMDGESRVKEGESNLDIVPFIRELEEKRVSRATRTIPINDTLQITLLVFVEKTKQDLSKSISSLSEGSIYKVRTEPNKSLNYSLQSSEKQSVMCKTTRTQPSADYTTLSISKTSEYIQESYENQIPLKSRPVENTWSERIIKDYSQQKESIPDFQEDFESISMIGSQQRASGKPISGGLILASSILFFILLCYFIITIEDQQVQLQSIKRVVLFGEPERL